MAQATGDRDGQRQPSELIFFTGASGSLYYKETFLIATPSGIKPLLSANGLSGAQFFGVNNDRVDLTAGLGASQVVGRAWTRGEFTFAAIGTGVSRHIGLPAYAIDDQTVGPSAGPIGVSGGALPVGMIVGVPTSTTYRVRIDNAIGGNNLTGLSLAYLVTV